MFISTITNVYIIIKKTLTPILSGKDWVLKTTLITVVIFLFFSFPGYPSLKDVNSNPFDAWIGVAEKINDPLVNLMEKYQPSDRAYTLNYRITAPLIRKILGLNIAGLVAFAFFVLVGFCTLVILIQQKKALFAGLFGICLAGIIWVCRSTLNTSRGMAYCFPALFVSI